MLRSLVGLGDVYKRQVIFRFEATSEKKLDQIKSLFRDQLLSLEDDLDLPF